MLARRAKDALEKAARLAASPRRKKKPSVLNCLFSASKAERASKTDDCEDEDEDAVRRHVVLEPDTTIDARAATAAARPPAFRLSERRGLARSLDRTPQTNKQKMRKLSLGKLHSRV